jgi:hypothetical protein
MTELKHATELTKSELQASTKPELEAVHRYRFLVSVRVSLALTKRTHAIAIAAERDAEASLT